MIFARSCCDQTPQEKLIRKLYDQYDFTNLGSYYCTIKLTSNMKLQYVIISFSKYPILAQFSLGALATQSDSK